MKELKVSLIFAAVLSMLALAVSGAYAQPDTAYVKGVALFKLKNTVPLLAVGKSGEAVTTGITWLDALSS